MIHEPIYANEPVLRYETRCECGWVCVEATTVDLRQRWRNHLNAMHKLEAARPNA